MGIEKNGNYLSEIEGYSWQLRINQHPQDPKYTLLIDREAILSFNFLPGTWNLSK